MTEDSSEVEREGSDGGASREVGCRSKNGGAASADVSRVICYSGRGNLPRLANCASTFTKGGVLIIE